MHKTIDVKLTSIFSPTCQALIHENPHNGFDDATQGSSELLVIRFENTIIGYASLKSVTADKQVLDSIYLRNVAKDHILGEQWFINSLKQHLENSSDNAFLLAS